MANNADNGFICACRLFTSSKTYWFTFNYRGLLSCFIHQPLGAGLWLRQLFTCCRKQLAVWRAVCRDTLVLCSSSLCLHDEVMLCFFFRCNLSVKHFTHSSPPSLDLKGGCKKSVEFLLSQWTPAWIHVVTAVRFLLYQCKNHRNLSSVHPESPKYD